MCLNSEYILVFLLCMFLKTKKDLKIWATSLPSEMISPFYMQFKSVNTDLWWAIPRQNILLLHTNKNYFCELICTMLLWVGYDWVCFWTFYIISSTLDEAFQATLLRCALNNGEQFWMHVQSQPVFLGQCIKSCWSSIWHSLTFTVGQLFLQRDIFQPMQY